MINDRDVRDLEADLAWRCGRAVAVHRTDVATLRIVLDPIADRGRIELLVEEADGRWTVSDRGASVALLGAPIDFVLAKMADSDLALERCGDAIVLRVATHELADAIWAFVDHVEFIPVLAGLWSEEFVAA